MTTEIELQIEEHAFMRDRFFCVCSMYDLIFMVLRIFLFHLGPSKRIATLRKHRHVREHAQHIPIDHIWCMKARIALQVTCP